MREQNIDNEKYREHLFRIFSFFISFCEKNNLNYWCATGTILGAVRHNNIIPWDDDIDVFMPRKDYEKLIGLKTELEADGVGIISAKTCDSFATYAKLYDKNTTLWEIESIPFVYGINLDIFPLDETSCTKKQFSKKYRYFRNLFRKYQLSQMIFDLKRLIREIKEGEYKMIFKDILSLFVPSFLSGYYRKRIIKFENEVSLEKGDHIVSYYGDYWEKEYFEKKWFENYIEMPFADLTVKVPNGYHEYLTNVYGDYMKYPPVEKRVSHHYHYYLNMDEGLELKEVKALLKTSK